MCTIVPEKITQLMGLREMLHHYSVGCLAAINFFRYAEIAFDTAPRGVTHSLLPFLAFVSLPGGEIMFSKDAKVVKCPPGTVARRVWGAFVSGLGVTVSLSILELLQGTSARTLDLSLVPLTLSEMLRSLSLRQLAVNYFTCCLYAGMLSVMCQLGAGVFALVLGYDTEDPMRSPMVYSQGVNDFWGRRWNRTVHKFLKRLFFDPTFNATRIRWLATLAAFSASATFHELLVHHMVRKAPPHLRLGVEGRQGYQVAFFVSQAVLCYAERSLDRLLPPLGRLARSLPYPVQVVCTAFVIAPFGPLFTAPLDASGLSVSLAKMFPSVVLVQLEAAGCKATGAVGEDGWEAW
eukprot:CAMPEP_0172044390 /NCGR_PEP_ID=MMETSP1041-20130122/26767_1 /TAXON_ID=464988 /ORGANISM="Hemiselmis andersenii, Strain CCMP439" /LENGTH=348 /DNA_ID=CAMNT_0012702873 /DNA_START=545 /DNA_END=1589 /DNA_ORIENTATION=-